MVKNQKGFTIIELLAMIVISGVIIAPLMFTLTANVAINYELQTRRSAASIADGALYGFDKMTYAELNTNQINETALHYTQYDADNCDPNLTGDNRALCNIVFGQNFSSVNFDAATFHAYIYDYYITTADYADLTNELVTPLLPSEVRDVIAAIPVDDVNTADTLMRITIWINYGNDPDKVLVVNGLIMDVWADQFE